MAEYVQEILDLQSRLRPMIPVRRLPAPWWIVTPEGDLCTEWCGDCGYYKVRNLRRRDPKNRSDYTLDGGWRTEEERFCFCHGCGTRLDVSLTDHGVHEELCHYEECGFTTRPAEDAFEIDEILSNVSYRSDDEKDEDVKLRTRAAAMARAFFDQTEIPDQPPTSGRASTIAPKALSAPDLDAIGTA